MIENIMMAMIDYANGNLHDIQHFVKVHAYSRLIGTKEGLSKEEMETLEIGAIVHDIACPLCREKYGHAAGHLQELEGPALVQEVLAPFELKQEVIDRVCYLVAHHHTYTNVEGLDYQILLEADFLVNGDEGKASHEAILKMKENVFKTNTGLALLKSIYKI